MNEIENLLECITNTNLKTQRIYLNMLDENDIIWSKKLIVAQLITKLVTKRKTRALGYRLLICYLNQYSLEVSEKSANVWLTIIFKSLNEFEIRLYGEIIFEALALLIENIQRDFNLSKAFGSVHILKVIEKVSLNEVLADDLCTLSALHTVEQCLKYYPRSLKSGKAVIEKFLIKLLDSTNPDIVFQTGECWLLLQKVRGSLSNGADNDESQWRDYQMTLLGSLYFIINKTCPISEEIFVCPIEAKHLEHFTVHLTEDPVERAAQVCQRFCNLIDFLKIALSKPFHDKKIIYTQQILCFIQRGLHVKLNNENNPKMDYVCFKALLPRMHIKLLELLEVLIDICHTHLRMHFRIILSILLESLERTKLLLKEGNQLQFVKFRLMVYKAISLWCSNLKEGSHCEIISETLISEILDDVTQRQSLLSTESIERKTLETPFSRFNYLSFSENEKLLRKKAFSCLHIILTSSGHLLRNSVTKKVHNALLEICIKMHAEHMKSEYSSRLWNCRLDIYKILILLLKSRNYSCPAPSEILMCFLDESRLFENSLEVRLNSQALFEALESSLHPQKEDLCFKQESFKQGCPEQTDLTRNNSTYFISAIDFKFPLNYVSDRDEKSNSHSSTHQIVNEQDSTQQTSSNQQLGIKVNNSESHEEKNISNPITFKEQKIMLLPLSGEMPIHNQDEVGSSHCGGVKSIVNLPLKCENMDDDKLIAELESAFVNELN
ncbi:proline-, glutamic acid- and leucine-rich protein 1 [Drosophila pseudoobscura]|uniref:Proline-, glutamic acid- and leucine-rich protein 1 n=1 Tax=Drosophila pseudoobscura pseudoobscura TaxID=46245 RepID=A0A6I8W6D8_DROPS|nr:proline-, glutamic acid- and leucine-rich protein 1 [Drosophila pseudoobscura]